METQKQKKSFGQWIKTSITIRMLMVGILILVLLIPLSYIKNLIQERAYRQEEVVNEINQKWGNEVLLYGPILKVPYQVHNLKKIWDDKTKSYYEEDLISTKYAFFFPNTLDIKSNIESETLGRSIYESVVYSADMKIKGSFTTPSFEIQDIKDEDILWNKATIIINSTNLKGIKSNLDLKIGSDSYPLRSRYSQNSYTNTLETKFLKEHSLPKEGAINFNLDLIINGSEQLRFIPIGRETKVSMNSNWASPSFNGNYLPETKTKEITASGFKATWKVLETNREFEQEFFGELPQINSSAFGVKLLIPVDEYQKSERATKYGYLVIALTFLVFFLIQTISKINIHPFQYLMIGLALTMFYTLLISISEHSSFLQAYAIAGIAVVLLISMYSKAILKSFKFMGFIAASLAVLYTFIFVIIQLENYALLVGSIGLFLILGTIMMISRKIDWGNY
ncbi:cell envelope integrity protein CreD [Aquimarina sp. 2201CG5-10]|uniref:cell envelope integrity protein CreD n=1 Tax=Aquimarina callyspongiae TaxID=3098150 RepID=UPI002AB53792|nr:cell envelope integrity protein CreD [Aquimarina sp. 2201CG5-10]MDY8138573.1 cell envelope integrity protein CreD [Aquimarina sp. 2201CG5-10]